MINQVDSIADIVYVIKEDETTNVISYKNFIKF